VNSVFVGKERVSRLCGKVGEILANQSYRREREKFRTSIRTMRERVAVRTAAFIYSSSNLILSLHQYEILPFSL
jgi:hypothetical protein